MKRTILALSALALCLLALPLQAGSSETVAPDGCGGNFIDLTEPALASQLAEVELIPLGQPEVTYVSSSLKESSGEFLFENADGEVQIVKVSCSLTCSGTSCLQQGCEPSGRGCSSWNCGSGCTGSCALSSIQVN